MKLRFFTGQVLHVLGLAFLLAAVGWAVSTLGPFEPHIELWIVIAVTVPIVHQIYVWVCWRLELLRDRAVSKTIGFRGYVAGFMLLFNARGAIVILAFLDEGSLGLPLATRIILATALFVPAAYAGYSVIRYFGVVRATGADHFDEKYRSMPLVNEGIFRYTSNGMYGVVFLVFWAAAIAFDSTAALIAAAFSHAHIWLHYFVTEKPDMDHIYGS